MLKRGSNVHEILKFPLHERIHRCIQCILVLRRCGRAECYLIFVLEVTTATVVREQVENQVYRNMRPLVPALLLVAGASLFISSLGSSSSHSWSVFCPLRRGQYPDLAKSYASSPSLSSAPLLPCCGCIVGVSCPPLHRHTDVLLLSPSLYPCRSLVIIVSLHWRPNAQTTARWRKAGLCSNEKRVGMSGHLP